MIENFINKYEYYKNLSLKKYNTYKIDVSCDYLVYPKSIHELQELLKYLIDECIEIDFNCLLGIANPLDCLFI